MRPESLIQLNSGRKTSSDMSSKLLIDHQGHVFKALGVCHQCCPCGVKGSEKVKAGAFRIGMLSGKEALEFK